MNLRGLRPAIAPALILLLLGATALDAGAEPTGRQIARGKYLVTVVGCGDCHTPGYFLGKPDMAKALSGSDVGFEIPGLGVFVAPNLTSDKETGLGNWSIKEIVTALKTGKRPDGRTLAPIMPWRDFAAMTDADADAIAVYLKSLAPIGHKVPGPFGPNEKPTVFVMKVVPPQP